MRILMLINGLYPEKIGGVEKLGADLARHLARNHELIVYTSHQDDLPVRETRDNYLIRRVKSAWDFKFSIPLGVRTMQMLRQLSREEKKPDIILSMSLGYSFVSYLSKKLFRIPFMIYVLGSDWYVARDQKINGRTFRLGIDKCDTLINQSDIIKNEVLRYFPRATIEVIPNGIDLPDRQSQGDKIVYLGRLHPVKGLQHLIEAVRGIEGCPQLLIAGFGPEDAKLKSLADGLNIRFLGRIPDSEDLFLQGKFFVLPSVSEGLPQVLLEAMSYGLPVIATKVGGIPEFIEDGRTGLLVEPGNPLALREAITRMLGDERLYRTMKDNCREEIQKYSWTNIIKRFERVMRRCTEG
ncbi:MAG: glycosyltransferase family 4 protein [Candidatus Latescibacterota bacterium]